MNDNIMQLDIFLSKQGRDEGIKKAVDHADRVDDDWSDRAYGLLLKFMETHVGPFMAEEFRSYCAMVDFTLPPSARAFGGVIRRASHEGIIEKVGHGQVKNIKAHRCFATIWIQVKKSA